MKAAHYILHIFAVLALVMASISPACAFASGKGFMTICKSDGSMATIIVSDQMDPFYDPAFNPDVPAQTALEMPECGFCFAANHIIANSVDQIKVAPVIAAHNDQFYTSAHPVHWRVKSLFDARAPPPSLSL